MSTVELQNSIIRKVLEIDDEEMLQSINELLFENNRSALYQLSEIEKVILNESMEDYKKGNIISNEEVYLKNKQWLEK